MQYVPESVPNFIEEDGGEIPVKGTCQFANLYNEAKAL